MMPNDSVAAGVELALVDHDEPKTMSGDQLCLALIVQPPLLAARNTGHSRAPIKDWH
ncbi:hypothetical protein HDC37_003061 [Microbacterium sp. AK009]|uniref:hypothetical protein n=1 Tax=Microbacterium sp. AK009 TaxID=2723068 RepID=UPI0015C83B3F|nr:hypothetical protein [Microbacterium sp. AK009]NYF18205.1 hypothetical protein [Microbacterium sp. AK009]